MGACSGTHDEVGFVRAPIGPEREDPVLDIDDQITGLQAADEGLLVEAACEALNVVSPLLGVGFEPLLEFAHG